MTDELQTKKPASAASRYLFVLVAGLILGIIATVMIMRAWQERQDPFPTALMTVMAKQSGQLRQAQEQSRCTPADTLPRLQALRLLTNDLDMAFPGLKDDGRFQQHASALRAALNESLSLPPGGCPGLAEINKSIAASCKACHQDFK